MLRSTLIIVAFLFTSNIYARMNSDQLRAKIKASHSKYLSKKRLKRAPRASALDRDARKALADDKSDEKFVAKPEIKKVKDLESASGVERVEHKREIASDDKIHDRRAFDRDYRKSLKLKHSLAR